MLVEALCMLASGMRHWGWIHRVKQHAVHLARPLLCAGCFWKTPERGKWTPKTHLRVESDPPTNPFCTVGIVCWGMVSWDNWEVHFRNTLLSQMFNVSTFTLYFAAFILFTLALFKQLSILAPKHGTGSSFANPAPENKGVSPPSNHDSSLCSYEITQHCYRTILKILLWVYCSASQQICPKERTLANKNMSTTKRVNESIPKICFFHLRRV